MGGQLGLEQTDGSGATFTLRLPSAPSPTRTLSGSPS
jgi:signal transduction histidine kinase